MYSFSLFLAVFLLLVLAHSISNNLKAHCGLRALPHKAQNRRADANE